MTAAVTTAKRRWRRVEWARTLVNPWCLGSERESSPLLRQTRLAQRPPAPREALRIPAVEGQQRDALAARLDEPAVPEVERRMVDLARLEVGPCAPKNITSAGCSFAAGTRALFGTSPLIWYVVRPRSTFASCDAPS